ncbi:MAG: CHAT domain-containing protein [Methanophagales archaeon]|nr:CHAT domain-containing protein [Methanophagales archaeon]
MTMNILHITDLGNGKVQIAWQSGSAVPRSCPEPIPFTDPLSVEDREALRWYLEEYLQFPYGAERFKAERVEKKMKEWGKSIFEQIFAECDFDPDPRSLYQEAVRAGLENCELCITSEDASFLNIPWELIYDPTQGRGYLAFNLAGLYRHRTGHKIEAPSAVSGDADAPFRILLVIARPYGERDVPLGMVARPMLEALRAQRAKIEVEVLRPPTFDELQRRLNDRKGYYNLVHFDGHGEFAQPPDSSLTRFGVSTGAGHLVFENEDGSPHKVSASELGQVLASAHVPLFVLNACQSAIEGAEDPFSSIASQLIATGAKGVVAMSYSVYAITAARFMQRFYEKLISHASLSEAVAAARRRLWTKRDHETSAGI